MAEYIVKILNLFLKIYSSRELEETLNKIREILSDDKHDWDQRANAVSLWFFYIVILLSFFPVFLFKNMESQS
jgi:hypothetical protein